MESSQGLVKCFHKGSFFLVKPLFQGGVQLVNFISLQHTGISDVLNSTVETYNLL